MQRLHRTQTIPTNVYMKPISSVIQVSGPLV
jgi:hypothetical protein